MATRRAPAFQMKYAVTHSAGSIEILANDHYVGIPFTADADLKAGDVVNTNSCVGICLYDTEEGAAGTVVIHGFINAHKLSEEQMEAITEAMARMPQICFIYDGDGK